MSETNHPTSSTLVVVVIGGISVILLVIGIALMVKANARSATQTRNSDSSATTSTGKKAGVALAVIGCIGMSAAAGVGLYTYQKSRKNTQRKAISRWNYVNAGQRPATRSQTRLAPSASATHSNDPWGLSNFSQTPPQPLTVPLPLCSPTKITPVGKICAIPDLNLKEVILVRKGVIGDGSCMIHAILTSMGVKAPSNMPRYRRDLSLELLEEDAPTVIVNKLEWLAVCRDRLSNSNEWLDNEFIPFFNRVFGVNIMEIRYDPSEGHIVNYRPTPDGNKTQVVIIMNVGTKHFETVGTVPKKQPHSTPKTMFNFDMDPIVQNLMEPYNVNTYDELFGGGILQTIPIFVDDTAVICTNDDIPPTASCKLASYTFNKKTGTKPVYRIGVLNGDDHQDNMIHAILKAARLESTGNLADFKQRILGIDPQVPLSDDELLNRLCEKIGSINIYEFVQTTSDSSKWEFVEIVNRNQVNLVAIYRSRDFHVDIIGYPEIQTFMNGDKDVLVTEMRMEVLGLNPDGSKM